MRQFIWFWLAMLPAMGIEPRISAEISEREGFLGDSITFKVHIDYEEGWTFVKDELDEKFGDATVLRQSWTGPTTDEALALHSLTFSADLAYYELGEYTIPKMELTALDNEGVTKTFTTPELVVNIVAMLEQDDNAMAPAKGQVSLDLPALWPFFLAGALLFLIVVACVVVFILRRGKAPVAEIAAPPPPAYDEALARLHELTSSGLLKEGRFKEFYVQVSLVIRHYYGRLYAIPAEEMTSFELEEWFMAASDLPNGFIDANREFSERCDRVKYAKHDPVEAENKEVVNSAFQIVELLKPQPREDVHVAAG